jgi:cob(I)alamin adenosyltransferase
MGLETGLIQVYDGDGKGKTTAAFGLALRAVGHGLNIHVIQFLKCSNRYGELKAAAKLAPMLEITQSGSPCKSDDGSEDFICTGCMKCHIDPQNPSPEDYDSAQRGLELARKKSTDGSCDILILDELNYALSIGLLDTSEIVKIIAARNPSVEIVVTGRGTPKELLEIADLVSTAIEVKHHYSKGISEVEGIDY